jgi:hypothetical protein
MSEAMEQIVGAYVRLRTSTIIFARAAAAGMKLFVIDPNGVDAIDTLRPRGIYNFGSSLQGSFIGASRRDLLTTLTRDTVERAKIMRFFS